jgi:hypothetical protein
LSRDDCGRRIALQHRPITLLSIPVLALLTALVLACVVACGDPLQASGPFTVEGSSVGLDSVQDGAPVVDGNKVTITGTGHARLSGDLAGTNESRSVLVMDTTTGAFTMEYDVTFTGAMGNSNGTITSHGVGSGQMSSPDEGEWIVEETIVAGTGDFENLTGTTHVEGKSTPGLTGTATFSGVWQYK